MELTASQVIRRARGGESLESIEADIEASDLDDERKAALWLAAFVERQRGEQRYIVRQSLILAGHREITPLAD
jgi:hypothetical protein